MFVRQIVITGANRGVGFALTKEFLGRGHKVLATFREDGSSKELKDLSKNHKNLSFAQLAVDSDKSTEQFKLGLNHLSHVDILVNNAGVMGDRADSLEHVSTEIMAQTLQINSIGPVRVTKALLPLLKKSNYPVVAQITSQMGSISDNKSGGYYAYRMSKAALNMFNRSLAKDYPNMICLALHPGWVQTEMGGKGASVTPQDCAKGLADFILGALPDHSGEFFNFRGEELEW